MSTEVKDVTTKPADKEKKQVTLKTIWPDVKFYSERTNIYTFDADADVEDMFEAFAIPCRVFYNGKFLFEGKLADYGIIPGATLATLATLATGPQPPGGPKEQDEKVNNEKDEIFEVTCQMRFGGPPSIVGYISRVNILTRVGLTTLTRNWARREHRTAEELCNDIPTTKLPTMLYLTEPTSTDDQLLAASYKITMNVEYTPEGYRLDCKSISNNNVYLIEEKTGKIINLGFSADWPDEKTCNLTHTITVGLNPWEPLKRGIRYLLCINSVKYLNLPKESSNYHLQMKVMNPYYPPGVADSSEGYSTTWRDVMRGEIIYVFRLL